MSTLWSRKVDLWYLRCFFDDVDFSGCFLHTFLVSVDCEDDEEEAETVKMRLRCCVDSGGMVKKGMEV